MLSKILPSLDYKKTLLTTLSLRYITRQILLVWLTRNFNFGRIIFTKHSHEERKSLASKEKVSREKKKSQGKIKSFSPKENKKNVKNNSD